MSSIASINPGVVATASTANTGTVQGAAALLVMKKAMQQQQAAAVQLLAALPQQPPLSNSGTLGTQVNTYA